MTATYADRIQGVATSVAIKAPVRVATTGNITLSGLQTIDGVTVEADDRVLVKNQTTVTDRGIWIASAGAWTRALDMNNTRDVIYGTEVYVKEGTVNGDLRFAQTTEDPVVGETTLTFSAISGTVTAIAEAAAAQAQVSAAQAALAAQAAGAPLYTTMPTISASIPSPFMLQTTAGVKVFTHDNVTATFAGWLGEVLFDDVATLLAYTGDALTVGSIVRTRDGYAVEIVSSGEMHSTAGSDKFIPTSRMVPPELGGAVGSPTDDTAAFQVVMEWLEDNGGGVIDCGAKSYVLNGLKWKSRVKIQGAGDHLYGFTQTTAGTVFLSPTSATRNTLAAIAVTAGGSGYATAPTVLCNGVSGYATAYVSGGAVVGIEVIDFDVVFSSPPTITFTGGGGSSAAGTAYCVAAMFKGGTTSAKLNRVAISDVAIVGNLGHTAGIYLHTEYSTVENFSVYNVQHEAIRFGSGAGNRIMNLHLFGCNAGRTGWRSGTLRSDDTDLMCVNAEIGAGYTNSTDLWNSAYHAGIGSAGALFANCVFEGSDVGARIEGASGRYVNCRADINYGHGWMFVRNNAAASPPWYNVLTGCWGHRNNRYAGSFDNFHLANVAVSTSNTFNGCVSSYAASDGWAHRYGFHNDHGDTRIVGSFRDEGAGTGRFNFVQSLGIADGLDATGTVTLTAATTVNVGGYKQIRMSPGSPVTVQYLTGGYDGQVIYVQPTNGNVTFKHGGTGATEIRTNTGADKVGATLGLYVFRNILGTWYEET